MKYCTACVMPDTRPDIELGPGGVCNACTLNRTKDNGKIDWARRRERLQRIADEVRGTSSSGYDCVVPVSGGKDSIYQTHVAIHELDLKPLCVTYQCSCRTPVGAHNIGVVKGMADHLEFTPDEEVRRHITLRSLEEVGDCCWLCHRVIFSYPIRIALNMRIPLVLYGENSQLEYGGTEEEANSDSLDTDWLETKGMQHGRTHVEWVDGMHVTDRDVEFLKAPTVEEIRAAGLRSLFLGYYLPWDSYRNLEVAKTYGFRVREDRAPEAALHNFKDIDCKFMTFHHYFKWLKFGYTRVTDHACIDIRSGLTSRENALPIVVEKEGEDPREYMRDFCEYLGITEERFWEIADSYRNPSIWKHDDEKGWHIPEFIGTAARGWDR